MLDTKIQLEVQTRKRKLANQKTYFIKQIYKANKQSDILENKSKTTEQGLSINQSIKDTENHFLSAFILCIGPITTELCFYIRIHILSKPAIDFN